MKEFSYFPSRVTKVLLFKTKTVNNILPINKVKIQEKVLSQHEIKGSLMVFASLQKMDISILKIS